MANKKFTPEEIAILKANPYVMEVTEDIIHFSASFKSSFWDRLQNGMKAPDIFRELGIDPNILGPNRVMGFKGMRQRVPRSQHLQGILRQEHDRCSSYRVFGAATGIQRPGD